jgi:hypothetical protein
MGGASARHAWAAARAPLRPAGAKHWVITNGNLA